MPQKGVLLVNLGSPDSTEVEDMKVFLREFLMDKNVIDAPYLIRKMIVEWFILPRRPKQSAEAYRSIWRQDGSPLIVISRNLQRLIQANLDMPVALAMRYGNPSICAGLKQLVEENGVDEIFLVPLYPHYARATFETVVEKVRGELKKFASGVRLSTIQPFFNEPAYIEALTASAELELNWDYDHLLFSFHGLPERHVKKADPTRNHCLKSAGCCSSPSPAHATCYRHQVLQTTDAFVRKMAIPQGRYSIAFQSKLGVDKWLEPSAASEIERLARNGVNKLAVICPAFVSDCIETLEEIGIRGRETFLAAGGEELRLIPCMNDHPVWVETLTRYCEPKGVLEYTSS
ncbi:MAG: ferrochelatase [bacterium]